MEVRDIKELQGILGQLQVFEQLQFEQVGKIRNIIQDVEEMLEDEELELRAQASYDEFAAEELEVE